jgi:hypothetical protein
MWNTPFDCARSFQDHVLQAFVKASRVSKGPNKAASTLSGIFVHFFMRAFKISSGVRRAFSMNGLSSVTGAGAATDNDCRDAWSDALYTCDMFPELKLSDAMSIVITRLRNEQVWKISSYYDPTRQRQESDARRESFSTGYE